MVADQTRDSILFTDWIASGWRYYGALCFAMEARDYQVIYNCTPAQGADQYTILLNCVYTLQTDIMLYVGLHRCLSSH